MKAHAKMTRRDFMARASGTICSISLPGVFVKLVKNENLALAADLRPDGRPRLPPGQQAVKRLMDMGGIEGTSDTSQWKLKIHGEVEKPMHLNFQDIMKNKQVNLTCDVHCVTGWTLLDSEWTGVPLTTIMDWVKIKESAAFVIFEAPGGYTSNIPIHEARKQNVILAHRFFGRSLRQPHGAPVRALVPDLYFYKSAKWLEGLKFTSRDEPGYWESAGFSGSGDPWE